MSQCPAEWKFINERGERGAMFCLLDEGHQGPHKDRNNLWPDSESLGTGTSEQIEAVAKAMFKSDKALSGKRWEEHSFQGWWLDMARVACQALGNTRPVANNSDAQDAARWRWCLEHPYETMFFLLEGTNRDSFQYSEDRQPTLKETQEYFLNAVMTDRGPVTHSPGHGPGERLVAGKE